MTLENWVDIKDEFQQATLILGNGFSIGIYDKFKYDSLWDEAKKEPTCGETRKYLTKDLCSLANKLETGTNFELLLRQLYTAKIVNEKFTLETKKIEKNYVDLRAALINTIKEIHCEHSEVEDDLNKRIDFLKQFKTVFSLSYDLLVYWIINLNNRKEKAEQTIKDCFDKKFFCYNWEKYSVSFSNETTPRTLVFFPHGALHLLQTANGVVEKIKSEPLNDLLKTIEDAWLNDEDTKHPLFVAEGDYNEKLRAIQSNVYLNTVYEQILPKSINDNHKLVIFGWKMTDLDKHLIKKITSSKPKEIAIGIHHKENKEDEIKRIKKQFEEFEKLEKEKANKKFFEIGEDFFVQ